MALCKDSPPKNLITCGKPYASQDPDLLSAQAD